MSKRALATILAIGLSTLACGNDVEPDATAETASSASQQAAPDAVPGTATTGPSDEAACETVWDFYEIIGPSDAYADRALRAAAAKAETAEAREVIEQEARYWRDGVPTWDDGAIDFCIALM